MISKDGLFEMCWNLCDLESAQGFLNVSSAVENNMVWCLLLLFFSFSVHTLLDSD